jgi:hypothetical protein
VATGRLLHARLASAQPSPPDGIRDRTDRWARAERASFDAANAPGTVVTGAQNGETPTAGADRLAADRLAAELVRRLRDTEVGTDLGPDQLVHGDLAGNVLLDARGVPVVIDVAPYWRPALWAEAVCVLDAVLWLGADPGVVGRWADGTRRHAMLRAGLFRLLSDDPVAADRSAAAFARALSPLLG